MNGNPAKLNARVASLAGYRCPYCRRDLLRFDGLTRVNTCPTCGGEVVTEEEWTRRAHERNGHQREVIAS